jgi:hypothetical protein
MGFMLFEVWSEDESGHQDLLETTSSIAIAKKIAQKAIENGSVAAIIYQETEDGDITEIERLEIG